MNIRVSVENLLTGVLVKIIIYLSMNDCECNKTCKIDKYLDIKSCSCKNCLFGN